jgi:hypothetical protein
VAALVLKFVVSRRCLQYVTMAAMTLAVAGCKTTRTETVIAVYPRPQHPIEPVPTSAQVAAAPHVAADEIYTVYSQNLIIGANADQRFRDRLMWVAGVYNGVNRGLPGQSYLELRTHDDAAFAYAALNPEAEPAFSALTLGTSVELLCRGDGAVGGSPLLRDCRGR